MPATTPTALALVAPTRKKPARFFVHACDDTKTRGVGIIHVPAESPRNQSTPRGRNGEEESCRRRKTLKIPSMWSTFASVGLCGKTRCLLNTVKQVSNLPCAVKSLVFRGFAPRERASACVEEASSFLWRRPSSSTHVGLTHAGRTHVAP